VDVCQNCCITVQRNWLVLMCYRKLWWKKSVMERKLGATAAVIIKKKICKAMYWYFLWYICLYGSQDWSICTNSPTFTTKITTAAVRIAFFSCSTKKKKQQKTFIQPCYFYRVLHKVWMPTKIKQIAFLCIFIIKLHNGIMTVWSFFLNRRPSAATWSMTKNSKQIFSEVLKMAICLLWSWTTPFLQSATVLLKTVRLWNCRSNISYVWSYSHS